MKTLKEQSWMLFVYAALFIAIGMVEFILGIINPALAIKVVSYIVAAGLLVVGLLYIVTSLIAETKAFFKPILVLGCVAITLGVLLFVDPFILSNYLVLFVAVLSLSLAAVLIAKAIIGIVFKYSAGWIVVYFLMAAVAITLGVLILVFQGQLTIKIIYCSIGLLVLALGVLLLIFGIKVFAKKESKEETVVAEQ